MKVQINDLAALERLIGGDTEVEMDIRNNIVQKFVNKHLKGLAYGKYQAGFDQFLNELQGLIKAEFIKVFGLEEVGQGMYGSPKVLEMSRATKESFRKAVNDHVQKFIYDATDVALHNARAEMDSYLEKRVKFHVNNIMGERTDKLIMEKVKEKLGTVDFTQL